MARVTSAARSSSPDTGAGRERYGQAVAVSGHMVDSPGRSTPRFPAHAEHTVEDAVREVLERWNIGPGSLVVSGGARGTDIIAAEQALELGADVVLLVALPAEELVPMSVDLPGTDWNERFDALRERVPARVLPNSHAVGEPDETDGERFERNNRWILNTARDSAPVLRALAVWDGEPGDGPGGTADFVGQAKALRADVVVIDPLRGTVGAP